jgi:hypothetical protein
MPLFRKDQFTGRDRSHFCEDEVLSYESPLFRTSEAAHEIEPTSEPRSITVASSHLSDFGSPQSSHRNLTWRSHGRDNVRPVGLGRTAHSSAKTTIRNPPTMHQRSHAFVCPTQHRSRLSGSYLHNRYSQDLWSPTRRTIPEGTAFVQDSPAVFFGEI